MNIPTVVAPSDAPNPSEYLFFRQTFKQFVPVWSIILVTNLLPDRALGHSRVFSGEVVRHSFHRVHLIHQCTVHNQTSLASVFALYMPLRVSSALLCNPSCELYCSDRQDSC
jgi:hypothetical protein